MGVESILEAQGVVAHTKEGLKILYYTKPFAYVFVNALNDKSQQSIYNSSKRFLKDLISIAKVYEKTAGDITINQQLADNEKTQELVLEAAEIVGGGGMFFPDEVLAMESIIEQLEKQLEEFNAAEDMNGHKLTFIDSYKAEVGND